MPNLTPHATNVLFPRWTPEIRAALAEARIQVGSTQPFSAGLTEIQLTLSARDAADAMTRVRQSLKDAFVVLRVRDFVRPPVAIAYRDESGLAD